MDSEDRLWFGENYANKLGMLDTKTGTIKEFVPPIPWNGAYPAFADGRGDIWTAGMSTDFVFRLKPSTGEFVSYLLPTLGANVRSIDGNANSVRIWIAEVHAGKITLLEPLD
jgi:virginiamycin B lyase